MLIFTEFAANVVKNNNYYYFRVDKLKNACYIKTVIITDLKNNNNLEKKKMRV